MEFRVTIPENMRTGAYFNEVVVRHTDGSGEFQLDFLKAVPPDASGAQALDAVVVARVVCTSAVAKSLLLALEMNIDIFEKKHGAIPAASRVQ